MRHSSPGRQRLVGAAEEVYWRAKADVAAKQAVVARARKDIHESVEMQRRARRRTQLKAQGYLPDEIAEIMKKEDLAARVGGGSAAAAAQQVVQEEQAHRNWSTCKAAVATASMQMQLAPPRPTGTNDPVVLN